MQNNQVKMGVILSYVYMGLHILVGLVYTPLMIRVLGQSEYGLYNTVSSTISTLYLLNLGIGSSYIRFYSRYKTAGAKNKIDSLNGVFMTIFVIIAIIASACGGFLIVNIKTVFDNGLTSIEYERARVLMALLTFSLSFSFPMGVFESYIVANEEFIFQKVLLIFQTITSPILTLPLIFAGYGSVGVVFISVLLTVIIWILNALYAIKKLGMRFSFKDFEHSIFKEIFCFSFFIALNTFVDQINWNIDKILLGRYRGTTGVAIYSVGYSLYLYYMSFSGSISSIFTPRVHSIVSKYPDNAKQKLELTELFIKIGRIQFLVLALIATGVIFFGKEFITKIWAGLEYTESYYVAVVLIIASSIALIQNLGIEIQRAQNKHQFRSIVYTIMAFINLGISIILCQLYGAVGSAIGTAISLILANGLVMNIYYHLKCNINVLMFWKEIKNIAKGAVLPILIGILCKPIIENSSVFIFFIEIALYSLIYFVSMWYLGMNNYEKELLKKVLKKLKVGVKK